jgi:hypothetical protein
MVPPYIVAGLDGAITNGALNAEFSEGGTPGFDVTEDQAPPLFVDFLRLK